MAEVQRSYVTPALVRWRRWTDGPLIVLAIGSLPFLLLELRSDELRDADRSLVAAVNLVVLIAFATDYLVEVAVARRRSQYVRSEWSSLLIVITQAIALVPGLGAFGFLRAIRGVRLFRVLILALRIVAIGSATARESRNYVRTHAASIAIASAALTWLTAAAAFSLAEGPQGDGDLYSFADSIWWSTATITTVGYGDIAPATAAGRVVAGITMFVGISSFAVVTAKVAEFLVRVETESEAP